MDKKDKEIMRLKKQIQSNNRCAKAIIAKLQQEIERLKEIIQCNPDPME